jgi:hypothetical protein
MGRTIKTAKKTTIQKKKKATPKRTRRTKARVSNRYEPARYKAQVSMIDPYKQNLPFHSLVGETNLDPYVWITLKKDLNKDPKQDRLNPIHKGLKSISLSNEKKKYPKVDFVLYVPDYRENKGDSGRSINEFIIGAEFYVKWGYYSNHTQWGPFRVTERDISFDEGTALLQVTGIMGARLFATSTAEVFSNAEGKLALEQVASLVGISVNKYELLDEEYKKFQQDLPTITAGGNLGQTIYKDTTKNDVDFYFDPEVGEIKLSTPFKYELVKQGRAKPIKMTYGYPTSNIAKLDVETKHPVKKGVSPNKQSTLKHKPKGGLGIISGNTLRYPIQGLIPYNDSATGTVKELIIGALPGSAWGKWIFSTKKVKDPAKRGGVIDPNSVGSVEQAIKNAEKVYPPKSGYRVSAVEKKIGEGYDATEADSWAMLIERIVTIPKNVVYEDKFMTITEYTTALRNTSNPAVLLSTDANASGQLSVRVYSPKESATEKDALPKKDTSESKKLKSTTVEAQPVGDESTPEGDEFVDVILKASKPIDSSIIANKGGRLSKSYQDELDRYNNELFQLKNLAFGNEDLSVKQKSYGSVTMAVLVRRDPAKPTEKKSKEGEVSDTSSGDSTNPNSSFKPKAQSSGVGRPSRRITRTKISIDLKAGDWTMRVGTIIEIVDLHKKINGYYYVFSEEHTIDSNGFHTSIQCRKASQRMVDKYSGKSKKRSGSKKPSNTTRKSTEQYTPTFENKADLEAREEAKELLEPVGSFFARKRNAEIDLLDPTNIGLTERKLQ